MKLATLFSIDLLLGAAAIFGVVVVTASDHPTATQGAIAWTLMAVAAVLLRGPGSQRESSINGSIPTARCRTRKSG
jgi:hypothetical protein